jgi:CDP-diacylglycerol---serine O-phosphatidyltransferase
MRKHIPNFLTSLNIVSGSLSVSFALEGHINLAVLAMFFAALFDFFDGMSARLLKAYSPIGKELDSLADMISFGLAPGMIVLTLQKYALFGDVRSLVGTSGGWLTWVFLLSAFFIPVMSGLRLAKFNIDERQSTSFIGLPTPANAIFFASLALIAENGNMPVLDTLLLNPYTLLFFTIVMSLLLVSEIPMFSLKIKHLRWNGNQVRYLFLLTTLVLIYFFSFYGITLAILLYILISFTLSLKKSV